MNILPALKTHLAANGVSRTIKLNRFTDKPVDQVLIIDTGEIEPDAEFTASTVIEYRTFQIIVRGAEYDPTVDVCGMIRTALHNKIGLTVGGFKFKNIAAFSGFQPITNEIGNYEFSGNFKCRVIKI